MTRSPIELFWTAKNRCQRQGGTFEQNLCMNLKIDENHQRQNAHNLRTISAIWSPCGPGLQLRTFTQATNKKINSPLSQKFELLIKKSAHCYKWQLSCNSDILQKNIFHGTRFKYRVSSIGSFEQKHCQLSLNYLLFPLVHISGPLVPRTSP